MVHANGDAAIDLTLEAYEKALAGAEPKDLRHRIEHCSIADDGYFRRMAAAGISPSFLMNHVYYWGKALRDNILARNEPTASTPWPVHCATACAPRSTAITPSRRSTRSARCRPP
jgi:predicted amidohydrolase YtcJ